MATFVLQTRSASPRRASHTQQQQQHRAAMLQGTLELSRVTA